MIPSGDFAAWLAETGDGGTSPYSDAIDWEERLAFTEDADLADDDEEIAATNRVTAISSSITNSATDTNRDTLLSSLGITATVAAEVWTRPCDSVFGTRCTRWAPDSNFNLP